MMWSDQMKVMINKLRRVIGDVPEGDEEPQYTDDYLGELVSDAVDDLESGRLVMGYRVLDGTLCDTEGVEVEVTQAHMTVYVILAQILFTLGVKSKADRENFSLSKGKLRVDTSAQSGDHGETLAVLEKRLRQAIYILTPFEGIRVE